MGKGLGRILEQQICLGKIAVKSDYYVDGKAKIGTTELKVTAHTYYWAADEAGRILEKLGFKPEVTMYAGKKYYYFAGIKDALKKFQAKYQLTPTGIIDNPTARKLLELNPRSAGTGISEVQKFVDYISTNYSDDGKIAAKIGELKDRPVDLCNRQWGALLQWQLNKQGNKKLRIDGRVGPRTWIAFNEMNLNDNNVRDFIVSGKVPEKKPVAKKKPGEVKKAAGEAKKVETKKAEPKKEDFVEFVRTHKAETAKIEERIKKLLAETGTVVVSDRRWVALIQWRLCQKGQTVEIDGSAGDQTKQALVKLGINKTEDFVVSGKVPLKKVKPPKKAEPPKKTEGGRKPGKKDGAKNTEGEKKIDKKSGGKVVEQNAALIKKLKKQRKECLKAVLYFQACISAWQRVNPEDTSTWAQVAIKVDPSRRNQRQDVIDTKRTMLQKDWASLRYWGDKVDSIDRQLKELRGGK